MSIIKSNSALIAFDKSFVGDDSDFQFLKFIQSLSFDIKTNRINSKHIGSSTSITNQFTQPEVGLNISFLHSRDFLNEFLFGCYFSAGADDDKSFFNKVIKNGFFNKNSFILFNDIQGYDLIYSNLNSSMNSISIGNLFLNNYSVSYKINQLPVVSIDFLCDNIKIDKITNTLKLKNWNDSEYQLSDELLEDLSLSTLNADSLVYVMNGLYSSSNFNLKNYSLGISMDSLLDGIIQSLDVSINLNRNKLYFFNQTSSVGDRKIILPITASLKISGISNNLKLGNTKDFFSDNSSFYIVLDLLNKKKEISSTVIYENLIIESFSYSINIDGFLEYSMDCSFQITDTSGIKIIIKEQSSTFQQIKSSDLEPLKADDYFLYSRN